MNIRKSLKRNIQLSGLLLIAAALFFCCTSCGSTAADTDKTEAAAAGSIQDEKINPAPEQQTESTSPENTQSPAYTYNPYRQTTVPQEEKLSCDFYEEASFIQHINNLKQAEKTLTAEKGLKAVILPHHLAVGQYIAAVFSAVGEENFETAVFIGPNHKGDGGDIIYSLKGWQTAFGDTECDKELTEKLMLNKAVKGIYNDEKMQADHAIAGLIPYLKYFSPDTETVSLLISGGCDKSKLKKLAKLLAETDEKILLVFSVDFSHYLQTEEAAEKDRESIKAIENFNLGKIADFDNDYTDSQPVLLTFLHYAKQKEMEPDLLWHGNYAEIYGIPKNQYIEGGITSYQIWALYEK